VWVGRLAIAAALIAGACAQNNGPDDPFAAYDPNDPFSDPFFNEGFGSDSLDEIAGGQSPSDDWLANPGEGNSDDQLLAAHADPYWGEGDSSGGGTDQEDDAFGPKPNKSFGEKAQEATLATMSVLVGAGMAALPYLIGAL